MNGWDALVNGMFVYLVIALAAALFVLWWGRSR